MEYTINSDKDDLTVKSLSGKAVLSVLNKMIDSDRISRKMTDNELREMAALQDFKRNFIKELKGL